MRVSHHLPDYGPLVERFFPLARFLPRGTRLWIKSALPFLHPLTHVYSFLGFQRRGEGDYLVSYWPLYFLCTINSNFFFCYPSCSKSRSPSGAWNMPSFHVTILLGLYDPSFKQFVHARSAVLFPAASEKCSADETSAADVRCRKVSLRSLEWS